MGKVINLEVDDALKLKSEKFTKNIKSDMHITSDLNSDDISFEWLDLVEEVCPYLDNLVRNPKVSLVSESEVRKIEKAKKTSAESVKDLTKHTDYIDKIDPVTGDVLPSRILVVFREETYNTYENRFIYTLILDLFRFITKKEELLKNLNPKNEKKLDYSATTTNGKEKITVDLHIDTKPSSKGSGENSLKKELNSALNRIAKMKKFINSWLASEFFVTLKKQHATLVAPPIKKTNLILKNPNFQMATKLWDFLYSLEETKNNRVNGIDSKGDKILKSILNDAFLMDYYVLDSISINKNTQKEKTEKYALLMIMNQVQRVIDILLQNGIKINEKELLKLLSAEIDKKANASLLGSNEIKNKFKKEMDEYITRTNKLL